MSDLRKLYFCKVCRIEYSVSVIDSHIDLLKKRMRCPSFDTCGGYLRLGAETNMKSNTIAIDAMSLYQASMGVGLPSEKKYCSPIYLRKLMTGKKIKAVTLLSAGDSKRSIIVSIQLDNDKIIYLASSTKGATVYKVTDVR